MNKYDIVIIGGGSAGIASAISAYDNGIKNILILEKDEYLGGILLQCIHNGFGLTYFKEELSGPEYAYRFVKMLEERNIEYKVKTMVLDITKDKIVTFSNEIDGYQKVEAKAIIMATGCSERTRGAISIPGDRVSGVLTAGQAQRYLNIDGYMVGKKVFILGSGDIGLIMARRMTLEGAEVLGVAELMPYSNGLSRNIVQCLNDYNIPLLLSHTVKRIIGKDHVEKVIVAEVDDKLNYIEGTEKEYNVDTLLLSVGLIPSNPLLEKLEVKMNPKTKGPLVDEMMQTSIPGIFACGNSLHVHDLVDFVSAEGMLAGKSASEYVLKEEAYKEEYIYIKPLSGIGYALPERIHIDNKDDFILKFRVNKPFKDVFVTIKADNEIIKKIKKPYLVPAEMENINIRVLKEDAKELTVEVSYE